MWGWCRCHGAQVWRPEGNCRTQFALLSMSMWVPGTAHRWSALAAMAFITFIH